MKHAFTAIWIVFSIAAIIPSALIFAFDRISIHLAPNSQPQMEVLRTQKQVFGTHDLDQHTLTRPGMIEERVMTTGHEQLNAKTY